MNHPSPSQRSSIGVLITHWRLGLHLLLGTRYFGVNNRTREPFTSWLLRPLFGFGWSVLVMPWRWLALLRIVRLRLQIAGLLSYSSRGRRSSPPAPHTAVRGDGLSS